VTKPSNWADLVADPSAMRTYLDSQRALVLSDRDLRNMNASGAFMPGSNFKSSSLDFADLRHAVMTHSRLDGVTLRGARLTDTVLHHSQISDSRFDEVSAIAARFDHATFRSSSSLRPMRLSGIFSDASFDHASGEGFQVNTGDGVTNPTSLRGASLRSIDFRSARFNLVDFGNASITNEAKLMSSVFVDSDFSGATIKNSSLSYSKFTRCRFIATNIDDAQFEESTFVDTEFDLERRSDPVAEPSAELPPRQRKRMTRFQAVLATFDKKTSIRNLEFEAAELRNARFTGTTLDNVGFSSAHGVPSLKSDLSGAVFDGVDLSRVEFRGVDLSGADLSSALGVSQELLRGACGNADTKLPVGHSVKTCALQRRQ
jgi:uncharacterized protein YjbI with pentapeptide repeats